MRPARRVITRQRRRILPAQSRLRVGSRRALLAADLTLPGFPCQRSRVVAALRHSRKLLTDIEGQLGSLLVSLRQEQPAIDAGALTG
jgi:hypothetical protein